MNREQCLHAFWSSFGWAAYDETSVPDQASLKLLHDDADVHRITYETATDAFGYSVSLTASLWSKSTNWVEITAKAEEIFQNISRGGKMIPYTNGSMWVRRGSPWAQRMGDSDDTLRRIVLNVEVEFIE